MLKAMTKKMLKRTVVLFFCTLGAVPAAPTYSQDWPDSMANRQAEFDLDKSEVPEQEENDDTPIRRGQVGDISTTKPSSMSGVLRRNIINPFDTDEVSETPAMQMLPEDITVPDLPDPEIQQQINLDEFRNYLEALVDAPAQTIRTELSSKEIEKQLNKINISSLMTTPSPYVKIDGKRFKIGDRFSIEVNMPETDRNMARIMQEQMPDPDTTPEDIYQEFEAIKQDALNRFRTMETKRQADAIADTHNVSVLISDIKHRKLILAVQGNQYVIPIKFSL